MVFLRGEVISPPKPVTDPPDSGLAVTAQPGNTSVQPLFYALDSHQVELNVELIDLVNIPINFGRLFSI